jgi:hypothetical protein
MVLTASYALNRLSVLGGKLRKSADTINRTTVGQQYQTSASYYALLRAYYNAEVYERADANVAAIKQWEGLPRYIRPIVLVPRRAVEWWPGHLFPGAWTPDGLSASNGRPNMIAYDRDTPEEVRLAVQQALTWGNGPRFLRSFGRMGPMLGNAFVELCDDADRRKVYPKLIDPDYLIDLEMNASGDVTMYRLAIPQYDEDRRSAYFWGKCVTEETITTYYDDEPRSYVDGQPAEVPNVFGFVPAVFPPHVATNGPMGAAAIDGTFPLIDEINGMVSSVNDYIMRIANQAVVIETPQPEALQKQLRTSAGATRTPTMERTDYHAGRQESKILPAPTGTAVHHLLEDIGLAASDPHIQRLERELEKTFPEIVLGEKLLEMDQVTRPGAVPLVQDVQHKYDESAGNYFDAVVRMGQMLCSMGGQLANSGAWGMQRDLTGAQRLFLPFSLESFHRGDLAWNLTPPELIPKTFGELCAEATALETVKTPAGLEHIGYSEEDVYGEKNVPKVKPGLLEQRQSGTGNVAALLQQAFNSAPGGGD